MKHLSLLQSQPSSIDELDKPHIVYVPNENTVYCYGLNNDGAFFILNNGAILATNKNKPFKVQ